MEWKDSFPINRYYESDNGIFYNADASEVLQGLPDNSIDLVLTDPPFGVGFENNKHYNDSKDYVFGNVSLWLSEMSRVLKEGSHIYLFVPTMEIDRWVSETKKYLKLNNILAFQSHLINKKYNNNNFSFDLQLVLFASKGKARDFNRVDWIPMSEEWLKDKRNKDKKQYTYIYPSFNRFYKANEKMNGFKARVHPNEKSVLLAMNLILISTNMSDTVLDPFAGSGGFLVAADLTFRRWIGSELNPEFCEIIRRRIDSVQPRLF